MKRSVPSTCILLNGIVTFERIRGEQGERFGAGSVFPPILQRLITAKMLTGKWVSRIDLHPIRDYLDLVLPGLANRPISQTPELTHPTRLEHVTYSSVSNAEDWAISFLGMSWKSRMPEL